MILNDLDYCPMPSARMFTAVAISIAANGFFLWALQQSAAMVRWLPHA